MKHGFPRKEIVNTAILINEISIRTKQNDDAFTVSQTRLHH